MPNTARIKNIMIGSAIGASAGATTEYAKSKDNKDKKKEIIKSSLLGGVGGGIGGSLVRNKAIKKQTEIAKHVSEAYNAPPINFFKKSLKDKIMDDLNRNPIKKKELKLSSPKKTPEYVKGIKEPKPVKDLKSLSAEQFDKIKYYDRLNKNVSKNLTKIDSPEILKSIRRNLRKKYKKHVMPAYGHIKSTDPRSTKVTKVFNETPKLITSLAARKNMAELKKKKSSLLNYVVKVKGSQFYNPDLQAKEKYLNELRAAIKGSKGIPLTSGLGEAKTQHEIDRAWTKNIKDLESLKGELEYLKAPKQDITLINKAISKSKLGFEKFRTTSEYLEKPLGGDVKYQLKKKHNRIDYNKFARIREQGMEKVATTMADIPGTPPWIEKMIARKRDIYKTAVERMKNNME
jgi:hypothetical protein